MRAIITLLSDFGQRDSYVGSMKGVVLGINPAAVLVDISHEVRPHHIFEAALVLRGAYRYFPAGTIHVAVVDPGVGSSRRGIVARGGGHMFVGPDNGIFGLVYPQLEALKIYHLRNTQFFRPEISATFHGRDVFAPAAAYLSTGVAPEAMGPEVTDPVELAVPAPEVGPERIRGEVVYTDAFGNLITNIERTHVKHFEHCAQLTVKVGNTVLERVCRHYQEVQCGKPLALIGSGGFLEIAVREGNARNLLSVEEGDEVVVMGLKARERS